MRISNRFLNRLGGLVALVSCGLWASAACQIVYSDLRAAKPVARGCSPVVQTNPTRWYPDPSWPVTPDRDKIGLEVGELIRTGVKHMGIVAQRIDGQMLLASVGDDLESRLTKVGKWDVRDGSSIVCFTGSGKLLWKHDFRREGARVNAGPWPAFVDLTGKGKWGISVFVMDDGGPGDRKGTIYMYDARGGKMLWERQIPPADYPGGNGSCVAGDFDNDGRIEIAYGLCNCVMCVDAQTGKTEWVYDDKIKICHGRLALSDIDKDSRVEITTATEYGDDLNDAKNDRSSILSLDGKGRLIRRMSNIQGDLGSTQIVVLDVDGDGKSEIIHGSENLCFREPRHMAQVFVRDSLLAEKFDAVSVGGVRFAVGDVDGDGDPDAVGITNYRDGGPYVKPEIYCVRVSDGKVKWRTPVLRVWLDGDAILTDIDGDGALDIVVTSQYSSGYMQEPGTLPWGDLYVLKGNGTIVYKRAFPDAVFSPIAVDVDGDDKVEIVVGCYDSNVYVIETPGPACDADWPVVCQNAQRTGVYPNQTRQ